MKCPHCGHDLGHRIGFLEDAMDKRVEEIRASLKTAEPKVKALQKKLSEAKHRGMNRKPIVLD